MVSPGGEKGNSDTQIGSNSAGLAVVHHLKFRVLTRINEQIGSVEVCAVLVARVVAGRVTVRGVAQLVGECVDAVPRPQGGAHDDEVFGGEPSAEVAGPEAVRIIVLDAHAQALRVLEVMGLIRTATGSGPTAGAAVTATPQGGLAQLLRLQVAAQGFPIPDVYETRLLLEEWAVAHLAGVDSPDLADAHTALEAMDADALRTDRADKFLAIGA